MSLKSSMLLAGDIGGTKTLLGLFEPGGTRPRVVGVRAFTTLDYPDLAAIVAEFTGALPAGHTPIDRACFGVAGPVLGDKAVLTNVPWRVDAARLAAQFHIARVALLNDLEAMAYAVTVLDESEVHVLQAGRAVRDGNIGLIAAGTGLGIAMLHRVNGKLVPAASEGGHADFAARNEREIAVLRWLVARRGRAEIEAVVSGQGLLHLHRVTHGERCLAISDLDQPHAAAEITAAGLSNACTGCVETLEMFVEAYGAEAGNVALRTMSTAGLFVGGGIAPKILPALTDGRFMRVFRNKAPYEAMLSAMPVKVILNGEAGLLGAAVYAAKLEV
jgi:glucokinase